MSTPAPDLADRWATVTSVALLGADRRPPPKPAPGPVADLLADACLCGRAEDPAEELAVVAGALVVSRRAGLLPGPPLAPDRGPQPDDRPMVTPSAAQRWHGVVREWPVLEDEWLARVLEAGWRLPPDLVVAMLRRHRTDRARRPIVVAAAGPIAGWLVERIPALAAPPRRSDEVTGPPDAGGLPELAMPAHLLALVGCTDPGAFDELLDDLRAGRLGVAHHPVLVHLLARARPEVLGPLADALEAAGPAGPAVGMARSLADLCRTRAAMLRELA